jgi:2-C-methyl-D-erythritol 4-phosphate cytidylyltransferase
MRFAIVLVAAGASTRMGFPKLWAEVCGQPLLGHAIAAAQAAEPAELVLVVSEDRLEETTALAPAARVVPGGTRRRDSVAAGLAASNAPWLAIHDAARALAPPELFQRGLQAAQTTGAAVPGLALKDTIKRVADSRVVDTPARADHVAVQTPQIFRRDLLERALALTDEDVTDEAALVEQLGVSVATPLDLALARSLLSS